ncbi:MAG TPA: hypothetical protein VF042_01185 [Gemmatimonadaceae bacterium]
MNAPKARMLVLGIVLISSTSACSLFGRHSSRSTPMYSITTNRDIYSRGNTGEATIRNVSSRQLEYNLCPRRLERKGNRYWVVAFEWPTAGGACTTELRRLPKGDEVSALFDIPAGIPIGTYRVVFTGLLGKDGKSLAGDDAASGQFTVR